MLVFMIGKQQTLRSPKTMLSQSIPFQFVFENSHYYLKYTRIVRWWYKNSAFYVPVDLTNKIACKTLPVTSVTPQRGLGDLDVCTCCFLLHHCFFLKAACLVEKDNFPWKRRIFLGHNFKSRCSSIRNSKQFCHKGSVIEWNNGSNIYFKCWLTIKLWVSAAMTCFFFPSWFLVIFQFHRCSKVDCTVCHFVPIKQKLLSACILLHMRIFWLECTLVWSTFPLHWDLASIFC